VTARAPGASARRARISFLRALSPSGPGLRDKASASYAEATGTAEQDVVAAIATLGVDVTAAAAIAVLPG
jgi:hypothetical protein